MTIRLASLRLLAESKGFFINPVWHNGMICFDLVRVSDEVIVLAMVGSMDIERYLLEL